jgi:hypothetical protein
MMWHGCVAEPFGTVPGWYVWQLLCFATQVIDDLVLNVPFNDNQLQEQWCLIVGFGESE